MDRPLPPRHLCRCESRRQSHCSAWMPPTQTIVRTMPRRKSKRRIPANEAEERKKNITKQRRRRTGLASKIDQYVELCDHDALLLLRNRKTGQFYTYISIDDAWPLSIKKSIEEIVSPLRHPLLQALKGTATSRASTHMYAPSQARRFLGQGP